MAHRTYFTLLEVAELVGRDPGTIMRWITTGKVQIKLRSKRHGRHRFTKADVSKLIRYAQ